jgi:cysteinyl-tRNA synthetase
MVELFTPLEVGVARIYVCGVTPYDVGHLGHALVYVVQDTLHRWLEFNGYYVHHIQNITDIDDDMVRKSKELGITIPELTEQNHAIYLTEMDALNVQRPDSFPLVSDHMPQIIEMVSALEENGFAYEVDGHVFFDTSRTEGFGVLAGYAREELWSAPRTDMMPDEPEHLKRDGLDFLLWKPSDDAAAMFESPWGLGRPGWHIECSAMARATLGDQIDIHGGGSDLAYPHHDSEIVQMESVTGKLPYVGYWVHNGTMQLDGMKMSKSLGNLVKVHELLDEGHTADAIRLVLLSTHYREDRDFNREQLTSAEDDVALFRRAAWSTSGGAEQLRAQPFRNAFMDSMDNDLDTPSAIEVLRQLAQEVDSGQVAATTGAPAIVELASVLGLTLGREG